LAKMFETNPVLIMRIEWLLQAGPALADAGPDANLGAVPL